jgi:hypothetical protein
MKPQSAKAKGRVFQQHVRDRILEYNPQLEFDDVKSTSMGAGGEDIQLSPAARKLVPLSIECKSRASFAFYKDLEQAQSNTKQGLEPVLICKANRKKPVAIVDLEWFLKTVRKAYGKY